MKLIFVPELSTLAERMGTAEYVEFIWREREKEQNTRELRRRLASGVPYRQATEWPLPLFSKESPPAPSAKPRDVMRVVSRKASNA